MENFFRKLHPVTIAVTLLLQFVAILLVGYDYLVAGLLLACLLVDALVNGARSFLNSLKLSIIIIIVMGIFNLVFYHTGERILLYVNDIPITLDALIFGLSAGAQAATLIVWFKLFSSFLSNHGIIYLLGRRFPTCALIISMVFSYYDKFSYKIDKIRETWRLFKRADEGKLREAGRIFTVLFTVMLEDSVTTAASMRARGYGARKRVVYDEFEIRVDDVVVFIAWAALVGAYIAFGKARIVVSVAALLVPAVFNLVKELEWKYYLSKI